MEMQHPHHDFHNAETMPEPIAPSLEGLDKEAHRRRFQSGMRWLGIGAALLVSSFAINYLLFHSNTSFVTIMYVMTTLGSICLVKCLGDILGF